PPRSPSATTPCSAPQAATNSATAPSGPPWWPAGERGGCARPAGSCCCGAWTDCGPGATGGWPRIGGWSPASPACGRDTGGVTEQTVSEKSTGKSTENATVRVRGAVPDVPRETWWQRLWTPFWMIPAVSVIAAVVLGVLLPSYEARDAGDPLRFAFEGGPDAAREVLGVIASAT